MPAYGLIYLLVGARILPGIGRRLYGKEEGWRGRERGCRRRGAVACWRRGGGGARVRLGFRVPAPLGAGQ